MSDGCHMSDGYTPPARTPDPAVTPEQPLSEVAYCFDGSLEGLLTAVFETYVRHEQPQDIAPTATFQPRLGQSIYTVETNLENALRVQRGIKRTCGDASYLAVVRAALSDDPQAGTIVYRFIRYAMQRKCNVLGELTHPAVEPLQRLNRAVSNECERMRQFIRFEHLENGAWFSRCNPAASVVPLIMGWFCARFNTQPFLIYDETHNLAGVYEGHDWYLVRTDTLSVPERASEENLMQAAWKRFYHTVAVEARYNPELRRQLMPMRLWRNLTEMQEDLPDSCLATKA